eukprot:4199046-Prymnesium_polylepis.1
MPAAACRVPGCTALHSPQEARSGEARYRGGTELPATTRELPLVPPNGNRARRSAKAALGVAG